MRPALSDAPQAVSVEAPARPLPAAPAVDSPAANFASYLRKVWAIAEIEVRKLIHDPVDIFTRAVQPVLWLTIFGGVFGRLRALPTGQTNYVDFLAPGILAQSVIYIAIFQGIAVIWERDQGILQKFLVSPLPRTALVLGKGLAAGVRGMTQAVTIFIIALIMGVHVQWDPLNLLGILLLVLLGGNFFATLSLTIAALVRTRERVQGIGQLITMPLFFASNALYPITLMPGWVAVIAHANPLSYMVDGLRELMIVGSPPGIGLGLDFGVLLIANVIIVALAARLYPNLVR